MIKLGRKEVRHVGPGDKKKTIIDYPDLNINDIQLPIGSSEVGKTVMATVMLRVDKAGPEIDSFTGSQKKHRSRFSVMGISFKNKKNMNIKNMSSTDLDNLELEEHQGMSLIPR